MRGRFDFALHTISPEAAALGEVDATLALRGAQGWEIRGLTALRDGTVVVALQRPLGEETPLPDAPTLSASLAEPLAAPPLELLERERPVVTESS
jgi:hypothetical protein